MGNCGQRQAIEITGIEKLSPPVNIPRSPKAAMRVSRRIDEAIEREKYAMHKVMKLLLLGPAESGKSTLLKQMKIIHLNGYTETELLARRPLIFKNVIQSVAQLMDGMSTLGMQLPPDCKEMADLVLSMSYGGFAFDCLSENAYRAIKTLWGLEIVQQAYQRSNEFHVIDCAKYFLDDLDRLHKSNYCPTETDILNARIETIGVCELRYRYNDVELSIIDVGGQRSERRKWINVFDSVSAIFFIAAVSEYDQKMFVFQVERLDNLRLLFQNRLLDALKLFEDVVNNPLFSKVQVILFLNKKDIFMDKIKRVPLNVCFPNYKYKNDFKNASVYLIRKFEKQIQDRQKLVYPHLTCAKDTDQMEFLMNSTTDMIIAEAMKHTGVT